MKKNESDSAIIELWGTVNNKREKPKKLPSQLTTLKGETIKIDKTENAHGEGEEEKQKKTQG